MSGLCDASGNIPTSDRIISYFRYYVFHIKEKKYNSYSIVPPAEEKGIIPSNI